MRLLIFICILFFASNTEGVCQSGSENTELQEQEAIPEDVIEEDEELEEEPYISPYEKSLEKYYQEDIPQRNFDAMAYKKATEGLDYTVEEEKPKKPKTSNKKEDTPPSAPINPAVISFLKWFFIIAAVILFAYLVFRFVDGGNIFARENRRIASSVEINLEKIEENLTESDDIDPLIQKAIAQKQYALAIRLYYLAILKELTLKNAIEWKKDKTNRAYVREMRNHPQFEPFKDMTYIFERTWYANVVVNETYFQSVQPAFHELLKKVK